MKTYDELLLENEELRQAGRPQPPIVAQCARFDGMPVVRIYGLTAFPVHMPLQSAEAVANALLSYIDQLKSGLDPSQQLALPRNNMSRYDYLCIAEKIPVKQGQSQQDNED